MSTYLMKRPKPAMLSSLILLFDFPTLSVALRSKSLFSWIEYFHLKKERNNFLKHCGTVVFTKRYSSRSKYCICWTIFSSGFSALGTI